MRLKEIVWEKSRSNSAVQSGRIGTEYVAVIKKVGKQWECTAGTALFQGGSAPVWAGSEKIAKDMCKAIIAGALESFCEGRLEAGPLREHHVSTVVGEPGGDQVKKGGFYSAVDLPEAVAMFIRQNFRHPDELPVTLLCLDKLEARRTSHVGF